MKPIYEPKGAAKEYGDYASEHRFDMAKWTSDGTHHWHAPTCGHEVAPEACSVCGSSVVYQDTL